MTFAPKKFISSISLAVFALACLTTYYLTVSSTKEAFPTKSGLIEYDWKVGMPVSYGLKTSAFRKTEKTGTLNITQMPITFEMEAEFFLKVLAIEEEKIIAAVDLDVSDFAFDDNRIQGTIDILNKEVFLCRFDRDGRFQGTIPPPGYSDDELDTIDNILNIQIVLPKESVTKWTTEENNARGTYDTNYNIKSRDTKSLSKTVQAYRNDPSQTGDREILVSEIEATIGDVWLDSYKETEIVRHSFKDGTVMTIEHKVELNKVSEGIEIVDLLKEIPKGLNSDQLIAYIYGDRPNTGRHDEKTKVAGKLDTDAGTPEPQIPLDLVVEKLANKFASTDDPKARIAAIGVVGEWIKSDPDRANSVVEWIQRDKVLAESLGQELIFAMLSAADKSEVQSALMNVINDVTLPPDVRLQAAVTVGDIPTSLNFQLRKGNKIDHELVNALFASSLISDADSSKLIQNNASLYALGKVAAHDAYAQELLFETAIIFLEQNKIDARQTAAVFAALENSGKLDERLAEKVSDAYLNSDEESVRIAAYKYMMLDDNYREQRILEGLADSSDHLNLVAVRLTGKYEVSGAQIQEALGDIVKDARAPIGTLRELHRLLTTTTVGNDFPTELLFRLEGRLALLN